MEAKLESALSGSQCASANSELSDEELARAAQRDRARFEALYMKYVARIFGYYRSRLHTRVDAEDLTAETFHKALRGLPRYRETEGRFAAWLYRIAHNVLVDHLRRQREMVTLDRAEGVSDNEGRLDPTQAALQAERFQQLAQALKSLPDDTREIVSLRIGGRLSYAEIGAIMGMNEQAVKARFHRAIKFLRTRWVADGHA